MVGQVAIDSMVAVERKFKDIVLRADVGVVDVAWAEKDSRTEQINVNVSQQRRALEQFDREFRDVLE